MKNLKELFKDFTINPDNIIIKNKKGISTLKLEEEILFKCNEDSVKNTNLEYDIQIHPVYEVGILKPIIITVCVWEIKTTLISQVKTLIKSYNYIEEK